VTTLIKVKAWSYSAWKLHDTCAAKYKYEKLLKLDTGPVPEVYKKGNKIHGMSEAFLKNIIKKLPKELGMLKKSFEDMKLVNPMVEQQIAFNKRWQRVNDYFGKDVWLRVKADIMAYFPSKKTALIVDVKTGKIRPENLKQLELYVPTAFSLYPEAEYCITEAWYTDHGKVVSPGTMTPLIYLKQDVPLIRKDWNKRVEPMFNDTRFVPTPGMYCKWCPFSNEKGGPCEY